MISAVTNTLSRVFKIPSGAERTSTVPSAIRLDLRRNTKCQFGNHNRHNFDCSGHYDHEYRFCSHFLTPFSFTFYERCNGTPPTVRFWGRITACANGKVQGVIITIRLVPHAIENWSAKKVSIPTLFAIIISEVGLHTAASIWMRQVSLIPRSDCDGYWKPTDPFLERPRTFFRWASSLQRQPYSVRAQRPAENLFLLSRLSASLYTRAARLYHVPAQKYF